MSVLVFLQPAFLWISGISALLAAVVVFGVKARAEKAIKRDIPELQKQRDVLLQQNNVAEATKKAGEITKTRQDWADRVGWAEVVSIGLVALGVAAQTGDSIAERQHMTDKTSKASSHEQQLGTLVEKATSAERSINALLDAVNKANTRVAELTERVTALEARVDDLSKRKNGGTGKGGGKDGGGDSPNDPVKPKDPAGGTGLRPEEKTELEALKKRMTLMSLRIDELERRPSFEVELGGAATAPEEFERRIRAAVQSLADMTAGGTEQSLAWKLVLHSREPSGSGS
jgi:hypothetical protein